MPRTSRVVIGGEIYHVINRANGRFTIFNTKEDYQLFEKILEETKELIDVGILAYVIMSNHWHLVLHPKNDGDLSLFMGRLTNTHTRKVHALTKTNGSGHLYQGRYKSLLVEQDEYLKTLIKYVERNPVRAKLSIKCEDWQWGSAYRKLKCNPKERLLIDVPPSDLPSDYSAWINSVEEEKIIQSIRNSVVKGVPYGRENWVEKMVTSHKLESTRKSVGHQRKYDNITTHKMQKNGGCPKFSQILASRVLSFNRKTQDDYPVFFYYCNIQRK